MYWGKATLDRGPVVAAPKSGGPVMVDLDVTREESLQAKGAVGVAPSPIPERCHAPDTPTPAQLGLTRAENTRGGAQH